MAKMRVYELSKELKVNSNEIINILKKENIVVRCQSSIDEKTCDFVRKSLMNDYNKKRDDNMSNTKEIKKEETNDVKKTNETNEPKRKKTVVFNIGDSRVSGSQSRPICPRPNQERSIRPRPNQERPIRPRPNKKRSGQSEQRGNKNHVPLNISEGSEYLSTVKRKESENANNLSASSTIKSSNVSGEKANCETSVQSVGIKFSDFFDKDGNRIYDEIVADITINPNKTLLEKNEELKKELEKLTGVVGEMNYKFDVSYSEKEKKYIEDNMTFPESIIDDLEVDTENNSTSINEEISADGKEERIVHLDETEEQTENNRKELLDIFSKGNDLYKSNVLEMTYYFDEGLKRSRSVVYEGIKWDSSFDKPYIGSYIENAIKLGVDISYSDVFIADSSHFSKEIIDGLKSNKYTIQKSKTKAGNYAPYVADEKGTIIKQFTLKKAVDPRAVLSDLSNLILQMQLKDIISEIDGIKKSMSYLVGFTRDVSMHDKFICARDMIKKAAYCEDEGEVREYLDEADKYLIEGIARIKKDIVVLTKGLSTLKYNELQPCMQFIIEDFQLLPRFVGLRFYILSYMKEEKMADELLCEYSAYMQELYDDNMELNGLSVFEVIHQYYIYDKKDKENMNFWLNKPIEWINNINEACKKTAKISKQNDVILIEDAKEV